MRRIWVLSLGVAVALACLVFLALQPPRPGVNHRNLKRIQRGMTEPQVEQILGGPGEDYHYKEGVRSRIWMEKQHRRGGIIVHFDNDGRVDQAVAFPCNEVPP